MTKSNSFRRSVKEESTEMKAVDEQLNQKLLQDFKNRTNKLVLDCCEISVNMCK